MFQHIFITRFSYRMKQNKDWYVKQTNPLDLTRLDQRFKIFESITLPSMIGQEYLDFTWMLIVDPELPLKFRKNLEKRIQGYPNIHIQNYSPNVDIRKVTWMDGYIDKNNSHIITTCLDDDDALFKGYTKYIKTHVRNLEKAGQLPPIKLIAPIEALQWDFLRSKTAPFGYVKPWLRRQTGGKQFPLQSGFSVLCKYPEFNFSPFFFKHTLGLYYFEKPCDLQKLPNFKRKEVNKVKRILHKTAESFNKSTTNWNNKTCFHIIERDNPPVLIVNHLWNDQFNRLFEFLGKRKKVAGPETFPDIIIDFQIADKYLDIFSLSLINIIDYIKINIKPVWQQNCGRGLIVATVKSILFILQTGIKVLYK